MGLLAVFVATFFVFRNSGRKVLRLMGTNARVSGLRILHADTPAYSS